jgi:hypothetical protein
LASFEDQAAISTKSDIDRSDLDLVSKPKIFISHSAKTEGGRRVLGELTQALNAGYDVLLDRTRLSEAAGKRWREALNTWMELCHGAIVILDETALKSEWVKQELAILTWRKDRDPGFVLLPIIVTPPDVFALRGPAFEAIGTGALQALIANHGYIDQVLDSCGAIPRANADVNGIARIESFVAAYLKTTDRNLLLQAADDLGEDLAGWAPNLPVHDAFARLIIGAGLDRSIVALSRLALSQQDLEGLVALLATVWLDCRAVATVTEISRGADSDRSLSVNAKEIVLCHWYIQRASAATHPWAAFEVRVGADEDTPESILEQVRRNLAKQCPPGLSLEGYLKQYKKIGAGDEPVCLLFSGPEPDRQILDHLRVEFPSLVFFCLTANSVPTAGTPRSASGAYFVRPELKLEDVDRALSAYSSAYRQLLRS